MARKAADAADALAGFHVRTGNRLEGGVVSASRSVTFPAGGRKSAGKPAGMDWVRVEAAIDEAQADLSKPDRQHVRDSGLIPGWPRRAAGSRLDKPAFEGLALRATRAAPRPLVRNMSTGGTPTWPLWSRILLAGSALALLAACGPKDTASALRTGGKSLRRRRHRKRIETASAGAEWLTYGGTYDEQRHSSLDAVNKDNVDQLGVSPGRSTSPPTAASRSRPSSSMA
jgi:hypothetical protein